MSPMRRDTVPWLIGLIAVQSLCAAFFLWDVLGDIGPNVLWALSTPYFAFETLAALALVAGIVFEMHYIMRLLRRAAHLEELVSIASGAFHEIILAHFDDWRLTPAESDVAMFAIKGFSVAETARLRGSAEGTVKAQLNAVYSKAGVSGRGALLGLLVDDLLNGGVMTGPTAAA